MADGGGCPRKEVKLHSSLSDSLAAPQLFPQATEMTYTYTHTHHRWSCECVCDNDCEHSVQRRKEVSSRCDSKSLKSYHRHNAPLIIWSLVC